MKKDSLVLWITIAAFAVAVAFAQSEESGAICDTDTDCMRFCPEGTADLPPDHPEYCDGGPQS